MTLILDRQKSKTIHIPHSFMPLYHKWEREMLLIRMQINQLKTIFEKASFILTKRDFDRLGLLDFSQISLQKRINLFRHQLKSQLWDTHDTKKDIIQSMATVIDLELSILFKQLASLKRDKFEKKKKHEDCL